jgi:hypothetical protein
MTSERFQLPHGDVRALSPTTGASNGAHFLAARSLKTQRSKCDPGEIEAFYDQNGLVDYRAVSVGIPLKIVATEP